MTLPDTYDGCALLTVRQTARILGIDWSTVYRWVRTGMIRAVRLSYRKTMIPRAELERLLNSLPSTHDAPQPSPNPRARLKRRAARETKEAEE